jgi:predicted TPR repeat methyltransferase
MGQKEDSLEAHREAIRIAPDHVGFRVNFAIALDRAGYQEEGVAQADLSVKEDPENEDAWLALGMIHQRRKRYDKAMEAFSHALDLPSARWSLGECLRLLGRPEEAAEHYRACLKLDPDDHHGAKLGLALVTGEVGPDRAPEAYVRHLFDDFAEDFDRCLVEALDYRGPALIGEALAKVLGDTKDLDVIDLGCGTGLAAPVLHPFAKKLDGIDLSPAMVVKAKERGLYDQLLVGDVLSVTGSYDLAVAADVLVYIGELGSLMEMVSRVLRPGGRFVFTVERADDGCNWRLGEKSRYRHSESYIRDITVSAGFSLEILDTVSTRSEAGQAVPGLLVVVKNG